MILLFLPKNVFCFPGNTLLQSGSSRNLHLRGVSPSLLPVIHLFTLTLLRVYSPLQPKPNIISVDPFIQKFLLLFRFFLKVHVNYVTPHTDRKLPYTRMGHLCYETTFKVLTRTVTRIVLTPNYPRCPQTFDKINKSFVKKVVSRGS